MKNFFVLWIMFLSLTCRADFWSNYPITGVPTYVNATFFPSASASGNGALAIALDTDVLYISTGASWEVLADPALGPLAITALIGDVLANGPGVATATVAFVGGSSAASVNSAAVKVAAATALNTASTLVLRDASGNFSAGTITASLTGTASGNPPNARTISTTAPLTGGGDLSANRIFGITQSTTSTNGYLSSTDWNTFNSKQPAGSYITSLTGGVTATGPGAAVATVITNANLTGPITSVGNATSIASQTGTGSTFVVQTSPTLITPNIGAATGASLQLSGLTASQAIVTDGSKNLTSSITTATELGYVNGTTSNIQAQLNARSLPQSPSVNQYYYISSQGNDSTGDGTYNLPFLTIAKAMGLITDAGASKRYFIKLIGTKIQEPTNVSLKPYVYIIGDSQDGTYLRINGGAGAIVPDSSWSTVGGARTGIQNIYLGGGTSINWDLLSVGPTTGTPSCNFTLTNVFVTGAFNYFGRIPGIDFLVIFSSYMIGNSSFDAVSVSGNGSIFQGNATFSATQAASNSQYTASSFLSNVTITAASTFTNTEQLNASALNGTLTLTDSGSLITLLSDSASYPKHANIVTSGSPTITLLSDAYGTLYSPTTSANWNSIPTVIQSGLDTLATSGIVKSQTQNKVLASPNGSSGVPSFRALVAGDLPAGTGTVTSVAATVPAFLSISGSPITTSGTLAIGLSGTALPVLNGGTGTTTSTGSGNVVLSTSPTLTTPNIGAATGSSLNLSGLTASQAVVTDGSKNLASLAYTSNNTASTIVSRDSSGNFSAGTVSGNATGLTAGALTNSMVSASAAIDYSKLATMTSANILVGNGSNVATVVPVSGDLTLANTGAFTIASGAVTNAKVAAGAAIDYSKLATMTSANFLVGNASNVATVVPMSGVISLSNSGSTSFASGAFGSNNISTTGTLSTGNATLSGFTDASAAAAGKVGEVLTASLGRGSATGITTNTAKTIATLSLTAGDWDIWAFCSFAPAGSTSVTQSQCAIANVATTSINTLPAVTTRGVQNSTGEITVMNTTSAQVPGDDYTVQSPMSYLSASTTQTMYLTVQSTFLVSTNASYGSIVARRRR